MNSTIILDNKIQNDIKQVQPTNQLENIKTSYILEKIFDNLHLKKSLEILKYNKKLQQRLYITLKDYKEYYNIEIEIIPLENRYGLFINIINEEEVGYYHIYFNNDKREINRNYININDDVSKIKIIIENKVKSLFELFKNCTCLQSISFKKFYRYDINNMGSMFEGCSSIKEIKLSNLLTNNVTNMSNMFSGCSSLNEINLSNININKTTDISGMFCGCSSLKELNLSNFKFNETTNIEYMFSYCREKLKKDIFRSKCQDINDDAFYDDHEDDTCNDPFDYD
jgi:surface protein